MRNTNTILFSIMAGLLFSGSALAMDWNSLKPKYEQAKAMGIIGEQPNGYLGVIKQSSDADLIVSNVNEWRKKRYQQTALEQGIPLNSIENGAGQRLYQRAEPGHYLLINGKWVKK